MKPTVEPQNVEEAACRASLREPLRPVFAVGGLYSTANGVAWIMRDLAAALGRKGAPVTVCAAECNGRVSVGKIFEQPSRWVAAPGRWLGGLSFAPALKPLLEQEIAGSDLVHNHSLWMLPTSYASQIAERLKKPIVISTHGALESWALGNSRLKKMLVGRLFQNRDFRSAACIHVNTTTEASSVRAYGLEQPIAVIPNGVDDVFLRTDGERRRFENMFPGVGRRRVVLFMGRVHKKKGLQLLLPAWARLVSKFPDWTLVVAGPNRGFESEARRLRLELSIENSVILTGNLQGDAKLSALNAAELFVLPSFSEGFSMAVLEAMAAGVPVLLTSGCNFPEAVEKNAAVSVEPTIGDVEAGLRQLLSLSDGERRVMGLAAQKLIASGYTWDIIAERMIELYAWLTVRGPRPAFVLNR